MKVLIQWARNAATGWEEHRSENWHELPQRARPVGGESLTEKGYVNALCIQGIVFANHDHYAIEPLTGGGILVSCWSDDPEDHPNPFGEVWELHPPTVANTRQILTVYNTDGNLSKLIETSGGIVEVKKFTDHFRRPPESVTRHGIWLPDALYQAHVRRWTPRPWMEWIDG